MSCKYEATGDYSCTPVIKAEKFLNVKKECAACGKKNTENFASVLASPSTGILKNGESITSDNGQYQLINQTDGHLCLNQVNGPAIACWGGHNGDGSGFSLPNHVDMQSDGNLCNYGSSGQGNWCLMSTYNKGVGPYSLKVTNDGKVQILDSTGTNLWE
jgi:hypothetical protein